MSSSIDLGLRGLHNVEVIGSGGSAIVYKAVREVPGRFAMEETVAVKVLRSSWDTAARRRFEREQRVMDRLSETAGFVPIIETGETDDGSPYIVMPHYKGGSLQQRLARSGPLDWPRAVRLVEQVAQTLVEAHELDVFHRDIKPANILLSEAGRPHVADFGISLIADDAASRAASTAAFTPAYSSPESFTDGLLPVAATDIYGLAATLWAILAGHAPFKDPGERPAPVTVFGRVAMQQVGDLRDRVPSPICRFIERSMAKRPEDRPITMAGFLVELQAAREDAYRGVEAERLEVDPLIVLPQSSDEVIDLTEDGLAGTDLADNNPDLTDGSDSSDDVDVLQDRSDRYENRWDDRLDGEETVAPASSHTGTGEAPDQPVELFDENPDQDDTVAELDNTGIEIDADLESAADIDDLDEVADGDDADPDDAIHADAIDAGANEDGANEDGAVDPWNDEFGQDGVQEDDAEVGTASTGSDDGGLAESGSGVDSSEAEDTVWLGAVPDEEFSWHEPKRSEPASSTSTAGEERLAASLSPQSGGRAVAVEDPAGENIEFIDDEDRPTDSGWLSKVVLAAIVTLVLLLGTWWLFGPRVDSGLNGSDNAFVVAEGNSETGSRLGAQQDSEASESSADNGGSGGADGALDPTQETEDREVEEVDAATVVTGSTKQLEVRGSTATAQPRQSSTTAATVNNPITTTTRQPVLSTQAGGGGNNRDDGFDGSLLGSDLITATTLGTTTASSTTTVTTTSAPTTSSTLATTATAAASSQIAFVTSPYVVSISGTSLVFAYKTNNVCGTGSFEYINAATGRSVGRWTGDRGCFGPLHYGESRWPGVALEPSTTYRVKVSVEGQPGSGSLPTGTGQLSTSFQVTTPAG